MSTILAAVFFQNVFSAQVFGPIITALLLVLFLGRPFIKILQSYSVGEIIRHDGPETHHAKAGTPTMGGVFLLLGMEVSLFIWADLRSVATWGVLLCILLFGVIGCFDDLQKLLKRGNHGVSVKGKLVLQTIASIVVVGLLMFGSKGAAFDTAIYIPFTQRVLFDLGIGYFPIMVLAMVFLSNAVNLTDGLDGLATGLAIPVALVALLLGLFSTVSGGEQVVVVSAIMLGGLLGFLWYNRNPARVFMGDTGSLTLGALLAMMGMMTKQEILIFLVSGVFAFEALSVMLQVGYYKRTKRRIFLMAPIHHHYEKKGWAETKVVQRFWLVGWVVMGIISIGIVTWGSGTV